MRDVLPDRLVEEIQSYLRRQAQVIQKDVWDSANADEDSVTGDFFGGIRQRGAYEEPLPTEVIPDAEPRSLEATGWSEDWDEPLDRLAVPADREIRKPGLTGTFLRGMQSPARTRRLRGVLYKWKVSYRKLRGRGPGAAEKRTGADGIFEIEVVDQGTGVMTRKGLPFQAKKDWTSRDGALVRQVQNMETFAPGGSAVFDYSADGFTAAPGSDVLESDGRRPETMRTAGELLADVVECTVGLRGLTFDAARGLFVFEDHGQRGLVDHRLRVEVEALRP